MSEMKDFVYQTARTLPVILLLDGSGSMEVNNRIGILNHAVREMLESFRKASSTIASISVAVIAFGGASARVHLPMTAVDELDLDALQDLTAFGRTPMGDAIAKAKAIIEDKAQIPSRAFRPTVVLVSDGQPNDPWEEPLRAFKEEGRSAKCYRMAMGIEVPKGGEAYEVLKSFASDGENVFDGADAAQISRFFQYVTMSTTSRIKSANPNQVPSMAEVFAPPVLAEDGGDDDDFPF
ncbi:MAG: VWA domain-containing protein [Oscillibacter sp.]|nr:VWA domain-containing protein [Oscillibacter sp.]